MQLRQSNRNDAESSITINMLLWLEQNRQRTATPFYVGANPISNSKNLMFKTKNYIKQYRIPFEYISYRVVTSETLTETPFYAGGEKFYGKPFKIGDSDYDVPFMTGDDLGIRGIDDRFPAIMLAADIGLPS